MAGEGGLTYQWVNCESQDTLAVGTDAQYNPEFSGLYQVIVYGENCRNISDCINFTIVSSKDIGHKDFKIVPNPTKGIFEVVSEGKVQDVTIFDTAGKRILQTTPRKIDISPYAEGVYIVKITIEGENYYEKVVLSRR